MYKIDGIDYSEREIEIISCMCNGCSSKLTANLLHISYHTVNSHVKNIMGKMNCFSRTAIMRVIEDSDKYDFIHSKYIEIRQLSHKKSQLIEKNFEKRDGYEINKVFVDRKLVIKIMISFITVLIVCLCLKSFNNDTNLSYEIQLPSEYSLLPRENIKKKIDAEMGEKKEEILVFVSFSMPDIALKELSREARKYNAKLVIRGIYKDSFKKTAEKILEIEEKGMSLEIDPKLFKRYGIRKVPTFVLVEGGEEVARLSGNVTLEYAKTELEKA